ncbi:hypothetical protein ACFQ51_51375 [Streptomyces kaempferi]
MRPTSMGRLAALASTALLLAGVVSAGSAQAQSAAQARYPGGLVTYSIEFSNPQEKDNNDLPEPYGRVVVKDDGLRETTLWEHPDLDINTPTVPRYPEAASRTGSRTISSARCVPMSVRTTRASTPTTSSPRAASPSTVPARTPSPARTDP